MKHGKKWHSVLAACCLAMALGAPAARAETKEITVAMQYGIGYMTLMVLQHDKLIEKHAKAAGVDGVTIQWKTLAGAAAMNDGLMSGSVDLAAIGPPGILLLWDRTHGTPQEVKAVCSLTSVPLYLITRNPDIKSIKDYTSASKIAVPSVKVSTMAVVLQMASEQVWGKDQYNKLDPITINRAHPDAMQALLSGSGEIDSHFSWPPFQYRELQAPGIHLVLNSEDVLGGSASTVLMAASRKFHEQSPKLYAAFLDAMKEASDKIAADPDYAARIYLAVTKDRDSVANISKMIAQPAGQFTLVPQGIGKFADFMSRHGLIKNRPASWKDLFFPEVHGLPGT